MNKRTDWSVRFGEMLFMKEIATAMTSRCEQRREEILGQAIPLFARVGYAELDLQVLADALGIGKGTLYRHFGSKEKLFLAAADRVMRDLNAYVEASVREVED